MQTALNDRSETASPQSADAAQIIRAAPFVFRVRSENAALAKAISIAYGGYPSQPDDGFIDFDLSVIPVRGLRRWLRPLVELVFDGTRPFAPLPANQSFPLLEWAMNWCVTTSAHHYLMCHSAVLARLGRAVVLPAPPGSGKSTLCAALMLSGWRLLSDELALIDPDSAALTPFVRPVSLKNASIEVIARRFSDAKLTDPVADTVKGTVAHLVADEPSLRQATHTAQPRWLVFPQYVAGSVLEIRALGKAEAVVELAKNAFNLPVLGEKGLGALVSVVESSRCLHLRYGDLDAVIAWFDRLAEGAT